MSKVKPTTDFYAGGGTVKWMQGTPGALRTAAHRAGMSSADYARKYGGAVGEKGKRARTAIITAKYRPK